MNKSLKTLVTAAALSAGLVGAAHATLIPVILTIPAGLGDTGPMTGSFADTIATGGAFTDDILFTAPPISSTDFFTATAGSGITFTGVTFKYFVPPTPTSPSLSLTSTLTASSITASTPVPIISGLYELEITGIATAGGKYSGTITAFPGPAISPVPEPETWALMLLGLGATGAFVRRRRQQHDA